MFDEIRSQLNSIEKQINEAFEKVKEKYEIEVKKVGDLQKDRLLLDDRENMLNAREQKVIEEENALDLQKRATREKQVILENKEKQLKEQAEKVRRILDV